MKSGILYIVSAASGTGKTSLNHAVMKQLGNLRFSVSYTTRAPRAGEKDGVDYHFVSLEKFKEMIAQDAFLEHVEVFGDRYGTCQKLVEEELAQGADLILEIDVQGAAQIRKKIPGTVSVFILPPSQEVLRKRLTERNQDHADAIERRLRDARAEIARCHEYDYLVINEDFNKALNDLKAIVEAERCRTSRQLQQWQFLIDDLQSS